MFLRIFRPEMTIYKRNFDEYRRIYFFNKRRKKYYRIYGNFKKKLRISSKAILILNLYVVKNI